MVHDDPLKRWKVAGLIATLVIVLSLPAYLIKERYGRGRSSDDGKIEATFVGKEKCIECHREAYDKWLGSYHDLAMDVATEETVLGNFDDSEFTHRGVTTRFYRRDGRYYVHTEGPGGKMGEFPVTHTFGFTPLQQYLVPFPGGRLQCLTIAWDVEKKRWFHLYPENTPGPEDWLHWTRNGQNWNGMCAECHSTNLKKNYDPKTDSYDTTWSEIDVSCEACHGPGSQHVAWAEIPPMARPETDNFELVVRTSGIGPGEEVLLCAPCHSRRTVLGEYNHGSESYFDTFLPALLREDLYYPDGQILEEVYVYGSYVQSKMYKSGVRCTDCHDVHSLKLIKEGNDLCLQCHRADAYNTSKHHFHKEFYRGKPSDGWSCVLCHMPGRNYMVIDNRADHSIRVPRPDLNLKIGVPDSCSMSGCHGDKPVQWSADWYTKWYGISRKPHFGTIIASGRAAKVEALKDLVWLAENQLYPSIVRSTALSLLRSYHGDGVIGAITGGLMDVEPLVRHTAVISSGILEPKRRAELIGPLLWDQNRVVRMEAARVLANVDFELLKPDQKKEFQVVLAEYEQAMEYSLDFAFAGFNLGNLYSSLGNTEKAEELYRTAIGIDDLFYPAKINLAMLYNRQGKNDEAERLLLGVAEANPGLHDINYSLGLLYVELGQPDKAASYLGKAAKGMPGNARIHYNYGLLLQQLGKMGKAEKALNKALEIDPANMDYLYAVADHYLKRGMLLKARKIAQQMKEKHPENTLGQDLLNFIDSRPE